MRRAVTWVAGHPGWSLLAAVLLSGWPSLGAGFRMDDFAYLAAAKEMGFRLDSLWTALVLDARTIHDGWLPEAAAHFRLTYFRPLVLLSCRLDILLWGDWAPGFHCVNLLLHFFASCLVFVLARALDVGREKALLGALLFAWFPQNAATVPWISTRAELLVAIFSLSSLIAYLLYRRAGGRLRLAVALVALSLALLTKEYALALPFLLLLAGVLLGPRAESARLWFPALLFFAALAGYSLVRQAALGGTGLPPSSKYFCPPFEAGCGSFAFEKLLHGLLMLFVLAPPAEGPFIAISDSGILTTLALCLLIGLAWLYGRGAGWDRTSIFFFGWSAAFLIPTAPFFPAPWHLYLPSAGSSVLLAIALSAAGPARCPRFRFALTASALAIFFAASFAFCGAALLFNRRQEARVESIRRELADAPEVRRLFFLDMKVVEYDLIQALRRKLPERRLEYHILSMTRWGDPPSRIQQVGAHAFEVEAQGRPFLLEMALAAPRRRPDADLAVFPGRTVTVGDYRIRIEAVSRPEGAAAAEATRLRIEIDQSLTDPGNLYFQMTDDRVRRQVFDLNEPR